MNTRLAIAALVALTAVAACGKKDNETADTSTMPGMDTTHNGAVVPTRDTVVKTTTTDTIQGSASDSAKKKADSTKAAMSTKTKTKTSTKTKTKQ
jgi:hypothetical protein